MSAPRNTAGVLAVVAAGLIVAPPGTADAAPAPAGLSSLSGTITDALGLTTTAVTPPATTEPVPTTTATTPPTTTESAPVATTTESTTTAPPAPAPAPTTTTAPATPAPTTTTAPATPTKPPKDDDTVGDDSGGNGREASAKHVRAEKRRKAAAQAKADRTAAKAERKERRADAGKAKAAREKAAETDDDGAADDAELTADGTDGDAATPTGTTAGPALDVADLLAPPSAVPNFFLSRFRIPPFLLPIYQAAGVQYGVRWEILAAINEIETDYGRNLNVSTAGALGWMQFMPATWQTYGVDANGDDKADPYNPVDAIFASARYLKAAGAETDIRKAIFAYNHADWYVDSVMLRARLISGLPADLVGSLTGLTQGVFPVSGGDATYAGAAKPADATATDGSSPLATGAAATTDDGDDADDASGPRRDIQIDAKAGTDAVAVQDGTVTALGETKRLGNYVQLRDVFGNRYTYAHLDELAKTYPAAAEDAKDADDTAEAEAKLNTPKDPAPDAPATAGRQRRSGEDAPTGGSSADEGAADKGAGDESAAPAKSGSGTNASPTAGTEAQATGPQTAERPRIFANPKRPGTQWAAGAGQQAKTNAAPAATPAVPPTGTVPGDLSATDPFSTPPAGAAVAPVATPDPVAKDGVVQLPLRRGARVAGGTVLGTVGRKPTAPAADPATPEPRAKMTFKVRPAGKGAPQVDPKPLLDGWKLLASTEIYRAKDGSALFGAAGDAASAGQVLLMSKAQLEKRVLADGRIDIYSLGRQQIQAGLIDRRILATLAYLSANGHRIAVSSLRRPGSITTSGNLSEHDSGNAVDIAAVDGQTISPATQGAGSITERTIRLLLQLQGTMKPHQIISLMTASDFGDADNVLALPDHADHIHVGFHVESSDSAQLGQQLASALKPGQWDDLIARLGRIENPDVPTKVSKYAVKATKKSRKP